MLNVFSRSNQRKTTKPRAIDKHILRQSRSFTVYCAFDE
uniref:Uncharacterized protein n=1 Tax=Rhizophora mucronata TaxID=61149 RepID=A0A2P2PGT3_RHIMU